MAAAGSGGGDGMGDITAGIAGMGVGDMNTFLQWKDTAQNLMIDNKARIVSIEEEVSKHKLSIKSIDDVGNQMQNEIKDAIVRVDNRIEECKMPSEACGRAVITVDSKVEYLGQIEMDTRNGTEKMREELKEKIKLVENSKI